MTGGGIEVARVYDAPPARPGRQVLIDRIWPRGISKAQSRWDEWCRDIAPTTELRRWYAHRPERFAEFRRRYLDELRDSDHAEALAHLDTLAGQGRLTLLTATKDLTLSHAQILADRLAGDR
ncbi:DUF488 domain-containing protein [Jatrophihabitans sp.]|jgi:uncharacterized protein YeaO (DUF488 family)|uniref:DUF488 domain-containing protein n=1 Tax=Jatrophihabitans sp. TaxID=1932789 RepID=UPI002F1D3EB0